MKRRPAALAHRRFQQAKAAFQGLPLNEVFERIHKTNLWGSPDSVSGLGSNLDSTARLRQMIPELLRDLGIKSMLDIPCGDFHWLSRAPLPVERYIGADIVEEIVRRNRAIHPHEFLRLDICSDPLPQADLVLCRDCLVHLSTENVFRAIANLKRSGSTWLLATHFLECEHNTDIENGDWRMINFERAPFSWRAPARVLVEGCEEVGGGYSDKALGLWRIGDLP
jgi:SAM-dependent methyltransferase